MKQIFKILLLSICLLLVTICFSQPATQIEWQNTIGGSNADLLQSIEQTSDRGFIIGGSSRSNISGDKSENSIGSDDYWIIKTDSSGNIIWQNTIGGNDIDMLFSVKQTDDNGYILDGISQSDISGDKTENSYGVSDYWVIKVDSSGIIQWQKIFGGSSGEDFPKIIQTMDGGYMLHGCSSSGISGNKTENGYGAFDYWVIKIDSSGNIQWQKTIGGDNNDISTTIIQTNDQGYIFGGSSNSNISGNKTENSNGNYDFWIVKLDSMGNILWQNTIGGSDDDILNSVSQTTNRGLILGGYSASNISGDKTENSKGLADYWIIKTDSIGNIQWQKTIGGDKDDALNTIYQTVDNGYILGGHSKSNISADKTENNCNQEDYWIVKTDLIGNVQWQNTISGNDLDYFNSASQTLDGEYIIGGYSLSGATYDKTEPCIGNEDLWILKLTGNYNLITGKLFIDENSNGIKDTNESVERHKKITENNGLFAFTDHNGNYTVGVPDTGTFTVSTSPISYFNTTPVSHNANFQGLHLTDSLNDFAFQPAGVYNDLCVTITPVTRFRPGSNASYQIDYINVGTTTISPTVIFFPDNVTYTTSVPAANSVTTDSVVWNFGPLAPYAQGSVVVNVTVSLSAIVGSNINSSARIEPLTGDANTACNFTAREVIVTSSLDPNDITVDEDSLFTTQFPNPPFLDYIIRFQNTGNDTAFEVKILNPVDTSRLDINSIEFVASSHPANMQWNSWERNMQFKFENILLPDSNTDEGGSHGFIRYRIKPKSNLVSGDSIANYAAIYFDLNSPVITNNAITRIVTPTFINNLSGFSSDVFIYPNPAEDKIMLDNFKFQGTGLIRILDMLGKEVLYQPIQESNKSLTIDINNLTPGVYVIEITSANRKSWGRFVRE